jgi:hypothetical protein
MYLKINLFTKLYENVKSLLCREIVKSGGNQA